MADVRSLLRQQRAARQQTKQQAPAAKKRKASEGSTQRKRTRTEDDAAGPAGLVEESAIAEAETEAVVDADADVDVDVDVDDSVAGPAPPETEMKLPLPEQAAPPHEADAELDAFMAEMDQAAAEAKRHSAQNNAATYSSAVISSAPMTAAELAAQAREEQNALRARRDEEIEGEKEDAARALEDEFDEMDGLEERVKKLRDQREALRAKGVSTENPQQAATNSDAVPTKAAEDSDSEDDDEEDWDDWRFKPA